MTIVICVLKIACVKYVGISIIFLAIIVDYAMNTVEAVQEYKVSDRIRNNASWWGTD